MVDSEAVAIFGGTFDPVHVGHLRSALEAQRLLGVRQVRLIPSFLPPHRTEPSSSPAARLSMLQLAIAETSFLSVDDREIKRQGPSYTVDTLKSIREEIGSDRPLILILGIDAFHLLPSWRDWQSLSGLTHIAVMDRPGPQPRLPAQLEDLIRDRQSEPFELVRSPHGSICRLSLTQMDISSSKIRQFIADGVPLDYLLPTKVIEFIRKNRLYRPTGS
jgi:nicotinate-nucleotide adenylyltransferase